MFRSPRHVTFLAAIIVAHAAVLWWIWDSRAPGLADVAPDWVLEADAAKDLQFRSQRIWVRDPGSGELHLAERRFNVPTALLKIGPDAPPANDSKQPAFE